MSWRRILVQIHQVTLSSDLSDPTRFAAPAGAVGLERVRVGRERLLQKWRWGGGGRDSAPRRWLEQSVPRPIVPENSTSGFSYRGRSSVVAADDAAESEGGTRIGAASA